MHLLLQNIWRTGTIPRQRKKAIIIPIFKKGDNRECQNYCGIGLLSIVGKVFMTIIQSRLQKHHEQMSREEQAGFRSHRGCCDQIFSILQVMEEQILCGKWMVIIFIDFQSTLDCIDWPALWIALETEHIPPKVIKLLQENFNGSCSQIRIRNELSTKFTKFTIWSLPGRHRLTAALQHRSQHHHEESLQGQTRSPV